MTVQGFARFVDLSAARRPYACWCLARGFDDLIYLYGPADDCRGIVAGLWSAQRLHRRDHVALEDARRCSELGARVARKTYRHGRRVRVMSAGQYRLEHQAPCRAA